MCSQIAVPGVGREVAIKRLLMVSRLAFCGSYIEVNCWRRVYVTNVICIGVSELFQVLRVDGAK